MFQLHNDHLLVRVAAQGAELQSLVQRQTGIEYLWQADPQFWGRHAPLLFPIVGRLKDNRYCVDGIWYELPQHGFARDMIFECVAHREDCVHLRLSATEATRALYPFSFVLDVIYTVHQDKLHIEYRVMNDGETPLLFHIGGHPGFSTALQADDRFEDYQIMVATVADSLTRHHLRGPFVVPEQAECVAPTQRFDLNRGLFVNDALIFEPDGQTTHLSLQSCKHHHRVAVSFQGWRFVGLWSPYPADAPFVCIEPWAGIADTIAHDGQLAHKWGGNRLDAGQSACFSMKVIVF